MFSPERFGGGGGKCALPGLEFTWLCSGGEYIFWVCELTCYQGSAWETGVWTIAKGQACSSSEPCTCLRTHDQGMGLLHVAVPTAGVLGGPTLHRVPLYTSIFNFSLRNSS